MGFLGHAHRPPHHPFGSPKGSFLCAQMHPFPKGLSFRTTGLGSMGRAGAAPTLHLAERSLWSSLQRTVPPLPHPRCFPRPFLEALLE